MPNIIWDPEERKPANAAALEAAIREAAPAAAQVKLTLKGEEWLVRALAPAALCGRGGSFSGRDLSACVAAALRELDLVAIS